MTKLSFVALFRGASLIGVFYAGAAIAEPADFPPPLDRAGANAPLPGQFIEADLTFLKTALKLTDAQLPAWDTVANVLRAQARRRDAELAAHRAEHDKASVQQNAPMDLIARLEDRRKMIVEEGDDLTRLIAAVKPLYAELSDEQKASANELLPPRPPRHDMPPGMPPAAGMGPAGMPALRAR